jgi:hypothetical protein
MSVEVIAERLECSTADECVAIEHEHVFRGTAGNALIGSRAIAKVVRVCDQNHPRMPLANHRHAPVDRRVIDYDACGTPDLQSRETCVEVLTRVVVDDDDVHDRYDIPT